MRTLLVCWMRASYVIAFQRSTTRRATWRRCLRSTRKTRTTWTSSHRTSRSRESSSSSSCSCSFFVTGSSNWSPLFRLAFGLGVSPFSFPLRSIKIKVVRTFCVFRLRWAGVYARRITCWCNRNCNCNLQWQTLALCNSPLATCNVFRSGSI